MAHSPFLFVKSYQERLGSLKNIFSNDMKASDIQKGWSDYLELAIEPVGWKAIWRISREICSSLKINFPCTVIVVVEHINFKDLSCQVSVNEVDNEEIHNLPSPVSDIPLIELYPTKEQDSKCVLQMYETAESIDNLRFFYHNLWMPWDLEFDEETHWIDSHLEGRLQLHFAVLEMKVPEEVVAEVHRCVTEGRHTLRRMEDLLDAGEELPADHLLTLIELHNTLSQLRNTYMLYEMPHLLKAVVERVQNSKRPKCGTILVLSTVTLAQLASLPSHLPSETQQLRLVPTLQEALVKSSLGGTVYVPRGEHHFHNLAGLKTGGSLVGLEDGVEVVGNNSGEDCPTLDLLKGCLALSRFTLRITSSFTVVKVRPGTECTMKEVKLHGSSITDGVDVHPSASFSATDCYFIDCQSALVCYPNSTVSLLRCTFKDNRFAIELREGCHLTMTDCTISGSVGCALKVHYSSMIAQQLNIQDINSLPQVQERGTIFKDNNADVLTTTTTTLNDNSYVEQSDRENNMECSF